MDESDEPLVTIVQFLNPIDAELARSRLEAFGVEAIVLDENIGNIQYPYAGITGGVRLQVRAAEADQAREILADTGQPPA